MKLVVSITHVDIRHSSIAGVVSRSNSIIIRSSDGDPLGRRLYVRCLISKN